MLKRYWNLRARITAWYVLLVALTLMVFSLFLHVRLQGNLMSQVDASLEAASSQALLDLASKDGRLVFGDPAIEYIGEIESFMPDRLVLAEGTVFAVNDETEIGLPLAVGLTVEVGAEISEKGLIALEIAEAEQSRIVGRAALGQLRTGEFAYRIIGTDGTVWDQQVGPADIPLLLPEESAFVTLQSGSKSTWRVHNVELTSSEGGPAGWLQTAKSLESVDDALASLRLQLFWGIPLAIVLASLGGFFLADRGFRPIDRITRTAQSITGSALNSRINYQGANDEVGRLATTFDAMLDRLERAFERERRFTADASHELRTPLAALKGRIDVTLSSPRSSPEYQETLRGMDQEVDRLIRLSNELLFLARLDRGQISWQPEEISLAYLLCSVVDQIRPLAEAKSLALIMEVPPDISVCGDPDHLIRLFLNLLDNAYKYTSPGGRIAVRAVETATMASISISDTGPGIPREHLDHLFEPFYRVDKARSRESGGVGLGLAIAHEITQLHQGKLEVQSRVGVGTTFTVTLPAQSMR